MATESQIPSMVVITPVRIEQKPRAATCTYRIAPGPRTGHKVLSLQTVPRAQNIHAYTFPTRF
jgi:hypothetical protein